MVGVRMGGLWMLEWNGRCEDGMVGVMMGWWV